MKNAFLGALVATLLIAVGYGIARFEADSTGPSLDAQGRGPIAPPRRGGDAARQPTASPLVYGGDNGGSAAAANGYMAVTGSYGVGTSVLYLFDTQRQQLLVYEARGGTPSMRRLVLVGARRIDLDLQLIDYNDESEYKRADLSRMFTGGARGRTPRSVTVPDPADKGLGTGEYETTRKGAKSPKKSEGR